MKENKQSPSKQQTIHKLLESRCDKYGDRQFIWSKWQTNEFKPHTYNEFYSDVQTFAAYLLESGFADKNIMIFSENSYYWLVASIAISGYVGTSVGVNKDWQDYDLANALKTVDTKIIIYSEKNKSIIEKISLVFKKIKYLQIDEIEKIISERKSLIKNNDKKLLSDHIKSADKICQIIFTTGSSGLPKAVPLAYQNMEICMRTMTPSRLPLGEYDTQFLFLPMSHIFGIMTAIYSFRLGMGLYICSDTSKIVDEMKEAKPTFLCAVPLFFERVYSKLDKKSLDKIKKISKITTPLSKIGIDLRRILFKKLYNALGGKLKHIVCGAATLDEKVKQLFLDIGINFVEAYGMSETCAFITMEKFGNQAPRSVGQVFDEITYKLIDVDHFGQGEIIVKGPNVFQGYYVGDSIKKLAADEDGFFHTGDLGRFDDKGRLFLTGRKKRLILTSNGENVSPDEMEKHFSEHLAIKRVKIYSIENQIAITIFAGGKEKRNDVKLRLIISHVNHSLPKFKRVRKIFIDRSDNESSVK